MIDLTTALDQRSAGMGTKMFSCLNFKKETFEEFHKIFVTFVKHFIKIVNKNFVISFSNESYAPATP